MSENLAKFEFGRVDEADDPQSFVDYLDSVSRAMHQFKQLGDHAQDVQEGDAILDLGCGPGDDTRTARPARRRRWTRRRGRQQ